MVGHVTENVVYEGLKHNRGISQIKRHKQVLKVTNWCVEGCLPLIFLSDSDKGVGVAEVLLCEDFLHDRVWKEGSIRGRGYLFLWLFSGYVL